MQKKHSKLQTKLELLKESDVRRAKSLDEDREGVKKLKLHYIEKRDECVLKTQSVMERLQDQMLKLRKDRKLDENTMEGIDEEEKMVTSGEVEELSAKVIQMRHKAQIVEEKSQKAELEKVNLEQDLTDTLAEFEKLEEFNTTLAHQYGRIQQWYDAFYSWNETASCPNCKARMDVNTLVEKLIKEKHDSTLHSSSKAPI